MLIFPSAPGSGEIFTAPDGAAWRWDGAKWTPLGRISTASSVSVAPFGNWSPSTVQTALEDLWTLISSGITPDTDWPETAPGQLRAFYIAADGNDDNAGSKGAPWATVPKVNAFAKLPGDTFMFRSGDTFTGAGLTLTTSGNATNPIRFGSYGQGASRAKIIPATDTHCVSIANQSYITVQNLIFEGNGPNCYGVRLDASIADATKYYGNKLLNLDISQCRRVYAQHPGVQGPGIGIQIANTFPGTADGSTASTPPLYTTGFADLVIEDCYVHHNFDGIIVDARGSMYAVDDRKLAHQNLTILRCVSCHNDGVASPAAGNHGSAVKLAGVDGALVEGCVGYENGAGTFNGPVGFWCMRSRNIVFRFCESHHNKTLFVDGGGFDIQGENVLCEYCYSHDNDGPGFQYGGWGNNPQVNMVFRFCVSENDGVKHTDWTASFGINWDGGADPPHPGSGPIKFYHCVGYQTLANEPVITFSNAAQYPAEFYNCIFYKAGQSQVFINTRNGLVPQNWRMEGNNYYSGNGSVQAFRWGTVYYDTLAQWRAASGQEAFNSQDRDWLPGLVDAGNGGTIAPSPGQHITEQMFAAWMAYRLAAGSQNRLAGINILQEFGIDPGSRDMFGTPIQPDALSIGVHCPA